MLYGGNPLYVIIVYDVAVERVNKVKKFLRMYLTWIQNSVFEGPLTPSQYQEVISELRNLIDENNDSIVIYKMNYPCFKKELIGKEKGSIENII